MGAAVVIRLLGRQFGNERRSPRRRSCGGTLERLSTMDVQGWQLRGQRATEEDVITPGRSAHACLAQPTERSRDVGDARGARRGGVDFTSSTCKMSSPRDFLDDIVINSAEPGALIACNALWQACELTVSAS